MHKDWNMPVTKEDVSGMRADGAAIYKQIDAMLGWMGAMGTFMMAFMSGVLALTLIQTALLGLILWRLW
jgi:hypothetical protein